MTSVTLEQIARVLGVEAPADRQRRINGVATLVEAGPDELSYLGSETYGGDFASTRAAAVIVQDRIKVSRQDGPVVLRVADADLALAKVLELFAPPVPHPPAGVDATACIAEGVELGGGVAVGPNVVVGRGSRIGAGTILHPGVVIGDQVVIGEQCAIYPNVVIRERITVGDRVIIHAGSVLGTDGFGYRWDGEKHAKIPQIGTVIVEDDVEIGSCVCIDRAKMGSTRIGRGTKIDNLVQVGHNVQIGEHGIVVGQTGLAGSVTMGRNVVLGGQSAIRDHARLGDGAVVAACAAVMRDVEPGMTVSGMPAFPHRQTAREHAAIRRLPDLVVQVRKLQDELDQLKKRLS